MTANDLAANSPAAKTPHSKNRKLRRAASIAGWAALVLIGAYALLLAVFWPFTQRKVAQRLSQATSSDVRFGEFGVSYFPPGCVIRDLEVRPAGEPNSPPSPPYSA